MDLKYFSTSLSEVFSGGGTTAGLKLNMKPHTDTIWFASRAIDIGIVHFRILKFFILPIALSTCILRDAILRPSSTSLAGSYFRPSMKGEG